MLRILSSLRRFGVEMFMREMPFRISVRIISCGIFRYTREAIPPDGGLMAKESDIVCPPFEAVAAVEARFLVLGLLGADERAIAVERDEVALGDDLHRVRGHHDRLAGAGVAVNPRTTPPRGRH